MTNLYRRTNDGEFMTSPEFFSALFAFEPADKDTPRAMLTGVWHCHEESCDLGEIHARGAARVADRLRCPACGSPMDLRQVLQSVILLPIENTQTP